MDSSFPISFSSPKPIRVAALGPLYVSAVAAPDVGWIIPPPACSEPGSRPPDRTCWLSVAGSASSSAKLRLFNSPVAYAATVQTDKGDWLKVSPERGTGGDITATADPSSLAPGDYNGMITVSFEVANYVAAKFPLMLHVVESAVDFRNAPPYFFFMGRRTDPPPPPLQVDVTATKDGTPFRIDLESSFDTGWLLITPREGVTPATLNITFDPRVLGLDPYRGAGILLRGPANTVTRAAAVNITDPSIYIDSSRRVFWAKAGGAAPAPQTIACQYGCSEGEVVSASTQLGGSWLNAARIPHSAFITVSANPTGLGAGAYEGAVSIAAPSNAACPTATVPVTLVVTDDDPSVAVEPPTIVLSAPSGSDSDAPASLVQAGYAPAVQGRVLLTEQRYPVGFSFTTSTENDVDWLIVSSDSAQAPGILNVRGNATDVPPGTYRGMIRVTAPPESKSVVTVPVTFQVGAALPRSPLTGPPLAVSLVNAASQAVGAIAPGELVTIHGVNLEPDQTWVPPQYRPGVRVLFDDVEAPVLYASPTQLNIAAPIELSGKKSVRVAIESSNWSSSRGGLRSVGGVAVAESAPGLFTADGSGMGQAVAMNLPTEESNTALHSAARGSEVRLIATGLGPTAQPTSQPILPISVKIANVKANIKRIALSPGVTRGLFEIDVVVPTDIAPGPAVPVVIEAGSASSPEWATIAVR